MTQPPAARGEGGRSGRSPRVPPHRGRGRLREGLPRRAGRPSPVPSGRSRSANLVGCPEQRARRRSPRAFSALGGRIRSAASVCCSQSRRSIRPRRNRSVYAVQGCPWPCSSIFLSLSVFVARNSACSHNGRILSSDEVQNFLEKSSGLRLAEVLAYLSFSFLHLSFLRAENWLTAVTQHAKRDRRDRNL